MDNLIKEIKDLQRWIDNIIKTLMEDELTLRDIIAEEESLDNLLYELGEKVKEAVSERMYQEYNDMDF